MGPIICGTRGLLASLCVSPATSGQNGERWPWALLTGSCRERGRALGSQHLLWDSGQERKILGQQGRGSGHLWGFVSERPREDAGVSAWCVGLSSPLALSSLKKSSWLFPQSGSAVGPLLE